MSSTQAPSPIDQEIDSISELMDDLDDLDLSLFLYYDSNISTFIIEQEDILRATVLNIRALANRMQALLDATPEHADGVINQAIAQFDQLFDQVCDFFGSTLGQSLFDLFMTTDEVIFDLPAGIFNGHPACLGA